MITFAIYVVSKANYFFAYEFRRNPRNSTDRLQSSFHFPKSLAWRNKIPLSNQKFFTSRVRRDVAFPAATLRRFGQNRRAITMERSVTIVILLIREGFRSLRRGSPRAVHDRSCGAFEGGQREGKIPRRGGGRKLSFTGSTTSNVEIGSSEKGRRA